MAVLFMCSPAYGSLLLTQHARRAASRGRTYLPYSIVQPCANAKNHMCKFFCAAVGGMKVSVKMTFLNN